MARHCNRKQPSLVLLDRDGVLNQDSSQYIKTKHEWIAIPGSLAALARLRAAGIHTALCTNQAGIGRGLLKVRDLADIHSTMNAAIAAAGGHLDLLRYCPHHPNANCRCRKPAPGMLLDCMSQLSCSGLETCFVGDSLRDMQAAIAAGCTPVLVRTGNGAAAEAAARKLGVKLVADDLSAAVDKLLAA